MYAADMRICGETWSSYTLKSVLVLAKDIFTFEPTQNLVQKNTRLRLRIWARMNLCVWSKVITVVRLWLYFLRFIRCYNHCKIWCEGVYQGKSFLLSVDYKKAFENKNLCASKLHSFYWEYFWYWNRSN